MSILQEWMQRYKIWSLRQLIYLHNLLKKNHSLFLPNYCFISPVISGSQTGTKASMREHKVGKRDWWSRMGRKTKLLLLFNYFKLLAVLTPSARIPSWCTEFLPLSNLLTTQNSRFQWKTGNLRIPRKVRVLFCKQCGKVWVSYNKQ